jgi:galactokinase
MNYLITKKVKENFAKTFAGDPLLVRSPGRVNIIGEHTDYNEGFVLPAAIDKAIYVAVSKNEENMIRIFSNEFNELHQSDLQNLHKSEQQWANYIIGVAAQLIKRGYTLSGFDVVLDGDVPIGAGLSSSAAVECAMAFALNRINDLNINKEDLAEIAQKAEHEYAGVMCGIMDQFASVNGKKDHVIKLDCRSMAYEYVPLEMEGYKILLLNTNVKHALSSSEYNTRRQQCEAGVALIRKHYPEVTSLRDVTMELLKKYVSDDPIIYKRCKYVIEENERLLTGCTDLQNGDLKALGKKMFRTHEGLSTEYEVSCKELDFLVEFVKKHKAVLGARMMGGGFGGCTINLVEEAAIDNLIKEASVAYNSTMNKTLTSYIAQTDDGTSAIKI